MVVVFVLQQNKMNFNAWDKEEGVKEMERTEVLLSIQNSRHIKYTINEAKKVKETNRNFLKTTTIHNI